MTYRIQRTLGIILTTTFTVLLTYPCAGQTLLTEDFDYSAGSLSTVSSGTWLDTAGSGDIDVAGGSLTYAGYSSGVGGQIAMSGTGEIELSNRSFASQTAGTVYTSFLIRMENGLPGSDAYRFLSSGGFIYILGDGGDGSSGFRLCVSKANVNSSCSARVPAATTHLIVLAYTFNGGGTQDDVASLWVNPATLPGSGSAPTPDRTESTGLDAPSVGVVVLEQSTGSPALFVDDVRVATSWSELPVELTSFSGRADGQDVVLEWETASEINNAGFEIETRSFDSWKALAFVNGAGSTQTGKHYSYRVNGLFAGLHVFRLKQIDLDGSSTYGPVIEVSVDVPGTFQLTTAYPNPFNPMATFSLSVARPQTVVVTLFDTVGKRIDTIHEGVIEANTAQEFLIDGTELPSGTYFIDVRGEFFRAARPVVLVK